MTNPDWTDAEKDAMRWADVTEMRGPYLLAALVRRQAAEIERLNKLVQDFRDGVKENAAEIERLRSIAIIEDKK